MQVTIQRISAFAAFAIGLVRPHRQAIAGLEVSDSTWEDWVAASTRQ